MHAEVKWGAVEGSPPNLTQLGNASQNSMIHSGWGNSRCEVDLCFVL